jgi:hypothetical protein
MQFFNKREVLSDAAQKVVNPAFASTRLPHYVGHELSHSAASTAPQYLPAYKQCRAQASINSMRRSKRSDRA